MRYIEGVDRRRKISFPEYIDAFVDSLNIVELEFKNANPSSTGRPGYGPQVLLSNLLEYLNSGIYSVWK